MSYICIEFTRGFEGEIITVLKNRNIEEINFRNLKIYYKFRFLS